MGKIYKGKMKPFPKLKSATTVIGFKFWFETKSDGNLDVNKILCRILLLFTSIITISLSIDDKPAFLLKLAFPFHNTDCSIYWVLKIGTTGLFGCRVISLSLCTILFVPILLCRKQIPPIVFVSHTEAISYQCGRHSMTDCNWSEMADCCSNTSFVICLW